MSSDDPDSVASERKLLRIFVDKISAMVAYWDAAERCRFANRAYERWFGVPAESLLGRPMSELLGPLYRMNLPYIQAVLRGEPQEFEREMPDREGGPVRHSLVSYIPDIVEGVVHGFFVLITDISAVKRAELALRQSEERFRLTIDEAPIGMALVAPDGRFLRVNHALSEIVGYAPEELTGLTFQAITHPDDLNADLALVDRLARGEIQRYQLEKRYIRKDGTSVEIMLSVSVLRGPDGHPIHYISQIEDITDRKRLEHELRVAEVKASGILSISADAIISIDEQQRITLFNEGAEAIFGYTRAEAVGASLDILIPERFRAVHRRHIERFAAGPVVSRRAGHRTIFGLRKNGEAFPADAAISKLEVEGQQILTVALRDITQQTRVEDEQRFLAEVGPLLAATLDYEQTLTSIADLAVRDIADFCIVDVVEEDGRVRRVKVASRDPAMAWVCQAFSHLDEEDTCPVHLVIDTKHPVLWATPSPEMIASLAQNEGQLRALQAARIRSIVAAPLLAHGKLLGAIEFVSCTRTYGQPDVRLAEELGQRAALSIENALLYRAAKRATEVRDDMLGIVAHDLRNPLNSVLMQVSHLQRPGGEPERRSRRPADAIHRAAARMSRLIQDLLDVTRMEAGSLSLDPVRLSPAQLVADALEMQRPLAAASSVELRLEVTQALPEIVADRDRLLQVFENLLGNALKFTEAGGHIAVGAEPRDGEVLFWVQDSGSGIDPEDVPHLFDRFWQARKAVRQGAGLGLPIVKGLVEVHRGRVWVESALQQGTTFYFTIPLRPPAKATRSATTPQRS